MRTVVALAVVLTLAGCLGGDPQEASPAAADEATPTAPSPASPAAPASTPSTSPASAPASANASEPAVAIVEPLSGTVSMSVAGACVSDEQGYQCAGATGHKAEELEVSGADTAGTFTFTWTALTPMTEEMNVFVNVGESFYAARGPSPLEIRVDALPMGTHTVGTWFAGLAGTGVVAGVADQPVDWTLAVDAS